MNAVRLFLLVVALAASLPAPGQVLSLEEALRLGEAQAPRLAAQRAMIASAGHQAARAGELPDPRLRLGIENLPVTGADRFRYDRDFMTMRSIGWMQDFPNAAKRSARSARAERARDVERAMLASQRATLQREIALAWFDLHFAERSRAAIESLVASFAAQVDVVAAAVVRGRSSAADNFMLRGALEQARDRVIDQERMIARARVALAALLGEDAKRPLGAPADTARLRHTREALLARLDQHPQLRVFDERENLARAEVEMARSMKNPDWSLELGYSQRRPAFDNMVSVMVAIELPWQAERRQDRDVAAKLAEADQARAQREDARRMHEAEIRAWLADHESAGARLERYERVLLPLARERVAAALAAYQGGRGELAGVLEANRALAETELGLIGVSAERARAWANLNFQFPQEESK
jgi:outer membrane protein TolC